MSDDAPGWLTPARRYGLLFLLGLALVVAGRIGAGTLGVVGVAVRLGGYALVLYAPAAYLRERVLGWRPGAALRDRLFGWR